MLPGHGGAEPRAPQRDGEGGGNGTCGVAEGEDGEAEARPVGRGVMTNEDQCHHRPGQFPPQMPPPPVADGQDQKRAFDCVCGALKSTVVCRCTTGRLH